MRSVEDDLEHFKINYSTELKKEGQEVARRIIYKFVWMGYLLENGSLLDHDGAVLISCGDTGFFLHAEDFPPA